MALQKEVLENQLKVILNNPQTENNINVIAAALATAIDTYIKSATITGITSDGAAITTVQIQ